MSARDVPFDLVGWGKKIARLRCSSIREIGKSHDPIGDELFSPLEMSIIQGFDHFIAD